MTSNTASATVRVVVDSTSQMTNSAFQLVDDLTPWQTTDFEILVNGQNIVVATNPGQIYYHQRATSPYSIPTNWDFTLNWPCQFESQTAGGQPLHAYIQYATDSPDTWRPWSQVANISVTNVPFPSGCTPAGAPYGEGKITVNNVPAGAKVWVTAHLDYAPKGDNISTVNPNPMTKPVTYGPFSSKITMRNGAAPVGTSFSSTTVIGRGKKVTMTYGVAKDSSGTLLSDTWVRLTQGTKSITALTGADGFYVFYDGQICSASDGVAGGCYTGVTPQPSTSAWQFGSGNQSTAIRILGTAALDGDGLPTSIPAYNATSSWPSGSWANSKVVSGSTVFATIVHPNSLSYTFTAAKGTAYNRDWRFTAAP